MVAYCAGFVLKDHTSHAHPQRHLEVLPPVPGEPLVEPAHVLEVFVQHRKVPAGHVVRREVAPPPDGEIPGERSGPHERGHKGRRDGVEGLINLDKR